MLIRHWSFSPGLEFGPWGLHSPFIIILGPKTLGMDFYRSVLNYVVICFSIVLYGYENWFMDAKLPSPTRDFQSKNGCNELKLISTQLCELSFEIRWRWVWTTAPFPHYWNQLIIINWLHYWLRWIWVEHLKCRGSLVKWVFIRSLALTPIVWWRIFCREASRIIIHPVWLFHANEDRMHNN